MRPIALLLSALMSLPASSTWAALIPSTPAFLNIRAQPLPKPAETLLYRNRYQIRADGSVWDPDGVTQVQITDLPDILRRLGSNQRLKALVQIDLVLSNSSGEKYLTPAEHEDVKRIARENWPFFTLSLRKNFKNYFTGEELEIMNRDQAPMGAEDLEAAPLKDMEPEIATEPYEPPEAPARRASLNVSPLPALLHSLPSAAPIEAPAPAAAVAPTIVYAQVPAPVPAAQTAAPATVTAADLIPTPRAAAPARVAVQPTIATPAPTPVAPALVPPAPVASVTPVAVLSAGPAIIPAAAAPVNALAAALPPGVSIAQSAQQILSRPAPPPPPAPAPPAPTPAPVQVPPPAPKPAPLPPPPAPAIEKQALPPAVHEIIQAEFERWLADAPYGREAKAMLRLISEKTPDFARSRVLNAILSTMPMVVIDSERAGFDRQGAILVDQNHGETGYAIALSPGPAFYTRKRMFFGSTTMLLSDSGQALSALHAPAPAVEALKRDAVALKEEQTDWGRTRTYADDSTRSYYTHQQMAGALLRELLLLDAQRQGWGASRFASEIYARSAQNMFYANMAVELKDDRFLDPDTRAQFHEWLAHPRDWHDELVHTLAAARGKPFSASLASPDSASEFLAQSAGSCPASLSDELSKPEIARRQAMKAAVSDLRELGLIDKGALESAAKAVDAEPAPGAPDKSCGKYWEDARAGIAAAAGIMSELRQGEARFRSELGSHAQ